MDAGADWKRMLLDQTVPVADPMREAIDPASRRDTRRRAGRLRNQGGGLRINLTPMIDVTFLLLVFFICTVQSGEAERVFRIDVPPMEGGAAVESETPILMALREPPLRVRIASSPEGAVVELEPRFATVDSIASLERVMRSARSGGGEFDGAEVGQSSVARGALFTADHPILIDPDRDCDWEHIVAAFNALLRAGYHRVGFAGADDAREPAGS